MKSVEIKEDSVYDPISDYSYFIEPTKGIENVPCGKKKIVVCDGINESFTSN